MTEIRRTNVFSVAKVFGIIGVLFGLLIGILALIGSIIGVTITPPEAPAQAGVQGINLSTLFGLVGPASIIAAPIAYGIGGFIGGALYGWFYNLAARFVGGIWVRLHDEEFVHERSAEWKK